MTTNEVLQLKIEDLDTMTPEQRARVTVVCRSIRGIVYGISTAHGVRNWERTTGMSIDQTKVHTLGLLTWIDELDEALVN